MANSEGKGIPRPVMIMSDNLSLLRESSDLWTLPLVKCVWQAKSREIDISAPDGSSRSRISGKDTP